MPELFDVTAFCFSLSLGGPFPFRHASMAFWVYFFLGNDEGLEERVGSGGVSSEERVPGQRPQYGWVA